MLSRRADRDLLPCVDWFEDRARDVADISAGAWTALAAWLAVVVGTAALVYAWRQYQWAKDQTAELMQPNVAMFMEPSATGWHLIELVAIRRPSAKYESAYDDRYAAPGRAAGAAAKPADLLPLRGE